MAPVLESRTINSLYKVYRLLVLIVAALALQLIANSASAVQPDEILKDPVLEARARALSANLRCLVCQNQSIDDSDAGLARDLRLRVRERLVAGDSDDEILKYMVARYGEFVLLKPTWAPHTYLLWLTPVLLVILALFLARSVFKNTAQPTGKASNGQNAPKPLSAKEESRLNQILDIDLPGSAPSRPDPKQNRK